MPCWRASAASTAGTTGGENCQLVVTVQSPAFPAARAGDASSNRAAVLETPRRMAGSGRSMKLTWDGGLEKRRGHFTLLARVGEIGRQGPKALLTGASAGIGR